MQAQLVTRHGDVIALETDREMLETRIPFHVVEILSEFAEAQRLGKQRRARYPDGFRLVGRRDGKTSHDWWARLKAAPERWAAHLAKRRESAKRRWREDSEFRARESEANNERRRRRRADPARRERERAKEHERQAQLRANPAKREAYERQLAAKRESNRRWREAKKAREDA